MSEWIAECQKLIELTMGHSGFWTQIVIGLIVLLTLVVVMKLITKAFKGRRHGWWRHLLAAIIGIGLIMASAVATSLYIIPKVDISLKIPFLFGIPVVVALLLAIPIQSLVLKLKYARAFIAFGSGVIACYLVLLLCNSTIESFDLGSKGVGSAKDRKASIDKVLGR